MLADLNSAVLNQKCKSGLLTWICWCACTSKSVREIMCSIFLEICCTGRLDYDVLALKSGRMSHIFVLAFVSGEKFHTTVSSVGSGGMFYTGVLTFESRRVFYTGVFSEPGITTLGQRDFASNGNEEVLLTPQIFKAGVSQSNSV